MGEILIRKYHSGDEKFIEEITYKTGFKGEDLTGKSFFDDKHLFYLIFIDYYPRYEPEHCFVAEEVESGKVIGFICGTPDTNQQETRFVKYGQWRILLHAITCTLWKYPKTFVTLAKMAKIRPSADPLQYSQIQTNYPAHLHINLLPGYQRSGTGSRLIRTYENHMMELGVTGIHLQTSSANHKAIPFYKKMGYTIVNEVSTNHFRFNDLKILTFAKFLGGTS